MTNTGSLQDLARLHLAVAVPQATAGLHLPTGHMVDSILKTLESRQLPDLLRMSIVEKSTRSGSASPPVVNSGSTRTMLGGSSRQLKISS